MSQDLRRTGDLYPLLQRSKFDKTARLLAQAARFEAGQVYLPREAEWLGAYLSELLAFPAGRHDDQVDATSQALEISDGPHADGPRAPAKHQETAKHCSAGPRRAMTGSRRQPTRPARVGRHGRVFSEWCRLSCRDKTAADKAFL